jgi:hypothetical protein
MPVEEGMAGQKNSEEEYALMIIALGYGEKNKHTIKE